MLKIKAPVSQRSSLKRKKQKCRRKNKNKRHETSNSSNNSSSSNINSILAKIAGHQKIQQEMMVVEIIEGILIITDETMTEDHHRLTLLRMGTEDRRLPDQSVQVDQVSMNLDEWFNPMRKIESQELMMVTVIEIAEAVGIDMKTTLDTIAGTIATITVRSITSGAIETSGAGLKEIIHDMTIGMVTEGVAAVRKGGGEGRDLRRQAQDRDPFLGQDLGHLLDPDRLHKLATGKSQCTTTIV